MESGLLNAFHDDHFESSFSKFEIDTNLWSDGTESIGLQLAENLHGILPSSPIEDKYNGFIDKSENEINPNLKLKEDLDSMTTSVVDYNSELISHEFVDSYQYSLSPLPIEIISVDPNCEFSSPLSTQNESDSSDNDEESEDESESMNDCHESDSSSIGDYESHPSDDESDDNSELNRQKQQCESKRQDSFSLIDIHNVSDILSSDNIEREFGQVKLETKTYATCTDVWSEDDPLEAEIDENSFDLPTFISQDDFDKFAMSNTIMHNPRSSVLMNGKLIKRKSDSDSDENTDIDVETICENVNTFTSGNTSSTTAPKGSFCHIEDDPIKDPSWSPTQKPHKISKPNSRHKTRIGNNKLSNGKLSKIKGLHMIKKSPVTFKSKINPIKVELCAVDETKKFGLGRGKNLSMCTKPEHISDSEPETIIGKENVSSNNDKSKCEGNRNEIVEKICCDDDKNIKSNLNETVSKSDVTKLMIKEKVYKSNDIIDKKNNIVYSDNIKQEPIEIESDCVSVKEEHSIVTVKRKLNLEEYKKRREKQSELVTGLVTYKDNFSSKVEPASQSVNNNCNIVCEQTKSVAVMSTSVKNETKNNVFVHSKQPLSKPTIQNNRYSLLLPKPISYDPITEAKNKVLRKQELKRVARTKLIDSTVFAKVGPITKILPLEEITSMKYKKESHDTQKDNTTIKTNSDYEEIIIVSVSSNTTITIPPAANLLNDQPNSLLYNISNTLERVSKKGESVKISSNSLICSIQDVVLKKSSNKKLMPSAAALLASQMSPDAGLSPPNHGSPEKPEPSITDLNHADDNVISTGIANTDVNTEHGEDKIIMHLRKNRIRNKKCSIEVQTEILPQFPPLKQLIRESKRLGRVEEYKNNRMTRRNKCERNVYNSYSTEDEDCKSQRSSNYRSISPYRSATGHSTHSRSRQKHRKNSSRQLDMCKSISPYRKRRRHSDYRSVSRNSSASRSSSTSSSSSFSSSTTSSDSTRGDSKTYSQNRFRRGRVYSHSPSRSVSLSRSPSRSRSLRSRSPHQKHDRKYRQRRRSSREYSRSRSRSHSRSHSHHQSNSKNYHSTPAVEERRIIYVGRIERDTTKENLKRKFSSYGSITQITLHYKDTGIKYGFVTFANAQAAYKAIDNSQRNPDISMYDISFGGRRAFCRSSYADLDGAATNGLQNHLYNMNRNTSSNNETESFESLLLKVREKIVATKPSTEHVQT